MKIFIPKKPWSSIFLFRLFRAAAAEAHSKNIRLIFVSVHPHISTLDLFASVGQVMSASDYRQLPSLTQPLLQMVSPGKKQRYDFILACFNKTTAKAGALIKCNQPRHNCQEL